MMSFTMQEGGFGTGDYVSFAVLSVASCAGGVWYSAVGSRTKAILDIKDYLLGGKAMSTFPVAMSLIASYVSGVTILGTPAEIYNYGSQYWLVVVGVALSCLAVATVYLPVFCTLRLSSSYEYLELRFNRHVRAVASILFLLDEVLFLPMVVYVPALAFNQLTGLNQFVVGGVMVLICGLYTVLGGLRAVVWTDSVQTGVMYIGVILVAAAGTLAAGGVKAVWSIARETGRADLSNWSWSPYERQTGWGAVVGGFLYWTCFNSVNQTMVQRYLSLPTKRDAVIALAIFCFGAVLAISLCVWSGLAAWAAWASGCGEGGSPPVDDRLLPAFVTWVARVQRLPGLAGVFLAGVFGAGLSSLSAVLNACALVAVEDVLRGWLRLRLRPLAEGVAARLVTAALAALSLLMLVVIAKLGGVLGVATALSGIAASATCGVFTLGVACWWVGARGAAVGAAAGAAAAGAAALGAQVAAARGLRPPTLPPPPRCLNLTALTTTGSGALDPETVFPLFRLSYHWIAPIGLVVTLLVGALVGWLFDDKRERKLDAELFTPLVWRFLPLEAHRNAGETRRKIAAKGTESPATSSPLILDGLSDKVEIAAADSR